MLRLLKEHTCNDILLKLLTNLLTIQTLEALVMMLNYKKCLNFLENTCFEYY